MTGLTAESISNNKGRVSDSKTPSFDALAVTLLLTNHADRMW